MCGVGVGGGSRRWGGIGLGTSERGEGGFGKRELCLAHGIVCASPYQGR